MYMKKLTIVYADGSSVVYSMKDCVDHEQYFERHERSSIASAILQRYPKKHNKPIDLLSPSACEEKGAEV